MNLISDICFLVAYHFLSAIMQRSYFVCVHVSFIAPVEGLCWKPKYRASKIHHFIFVLSLFFLSLSPVVMISLLF